MSALLSRPVMFTRRHIGRLTLAMAGVLASASCDGARTHAAAPAASRASASAASRASAPVAAPAPPDPWQIRFTGAGNAEVTATAVGLDGSVWLAGSFAREMAARERRWTSPTGDFSLRIWVARLSPGGALDWLVQLPGNHQGEPHDIALRRNGSVALAASFQGTVEAPDGALRSRGDDALVAVFDRDGRLLWARSGGGDGHDAARGIDIDPGGGLVLVGSFTGRADFGGRRLDSIPGPHVASRDGFVARYAAGGGLIRIDRFGGSHDDEAQAVAVRGDGSAVVAGHFGGTAAVGELSLTARSIGAHAANPADALVAAFDVDGAVLWASHAGGGPWTFARAIDDYPDGSVVVAGELIGRASFGRDATVEVGEPGDRAEAFAARFESSGELRWATATRGGGRAWAVSASADATWIAGDHADGARFPGGDRLATGSRHGGFVARLDRRGALVWATPVGRGRARIAGVAADGHGRVIAVGSAGDPIAAGQEPAEPDDYDGIAVVLTAAGQAPPR